MEEAAGDARPDDVDEVGDGDLLVVEEVHSGEEALALLRHVKWFYSRALSRHSCTVVIRILRDLCQRNPTWSSLKCWPPPPPKHHRGGRKQRISSSGEAEGATLEKILSSRIPKNVLKRRPRGSRTCQMGNQHMDLRQSSMPALLGGGESKER